MQQLPLIGGAYSARSIIANAQRCQNLFPEGNRKDSPTNTTHYQRPGLVPLVSPPAAGIGQGFYQASNGDGYVVIANGLFLVDSNFALHHLGNITNPLNSLVSMTDNGIQLLLVDGVPYGGNANGSVSFAGNPSNLDTVTFNGVVYTFKTVPVNPTDVLIGGTTGITIGANLLNKLLASVDPLITVGYYTAGSSGGNTLLYVTYKLPGAIGTTYTLAASVGTPSAATLVLGSPFVGYGYRVNLGDVTGATFVALTDASWTGADRVDFIDTFIVWNMPGTRNFGSTLSNQIEPLDPTYLAGKTAWPDPIVALIICQEQLFLLGSLKSEIWYDAGNSTFPFARQAGTSIQHGCVAKFSPASADLDVFWLSADLQGKGIVLRVRGNDVKRISNFALEYAISQMTTISDAVGYTYLQAGHIFYVLSFPSADQTWVWDASVGDPELGWSQRGWTDTSGAFHRDRGVLGGALYGKVVALDWENGTLYEQSQNIYTDTLQTISAGTTTSREYPLTFLRTFPHLMSGKDPASGQPILANGQMVKHERFAMDVECGNVPEGTSPQFTLRYSDDRGATWTGTVLLPGGQRGQYGTRPDAVGLGTAMDRVYEVSWSFPGKVALNGAWVEGTVLPR